MTIPELIDKYEVPEEYHEAIKIAYTLGVVKAVENLKDTNVPEFIKAFNMGLQEK